jgi:magnesium chelatase family protein
MVGGGTKPMPGEISLSHNGILFLDELMEFPDSTLQALREPMEDRRITVSRAMSSYIFPADFQLIAATNPCRCGYLFSKQHTCTCRPHIIQNLYRKILGPFLDRVSVEIETPEEPPEFINNNGVYARWKNLN